MTFRALLLVASWPVMLAAAAPETPKAALFRSGGISQSEMEARGAGALYPLRRELYDLQVRLAGDLAFDRLVEEEARQRKLNPKDHVRQEVDKHYREPTAQEIQAMLPEWRRTHTIPDEPVAAQKAVLELVKEKARLQAFEAYRAEVLDRGGFQMELEPPRLEAVIRPHHPVEGSASATTTLVVYSDFQCDYCKALNDTLKALLLRHRDRLRIVHKQTPLAEHPLARKAAHAYLARGGKAEVRDLLFASGGKLDTPDLQRALLPTDKDAPTEQQLDARIDEDLREATQFGITGTPAMLINGRLIEGAPPIELLERMLDEEDFWALRRRQAATAPRP